VLNRTVEHPPPALEKFILKYKTLVDETRRPLGKPVGGVRIKAFVPQVQGLNPLDPPFGMFV